MTKGRKPRLRPATVKAAVFFLAPRREDYEHFLGELSPVKNVNAGGAPSPPGDRLAEMTRAANQRSLKKATTRYLNQRSPLSKKGQRTKSASVDTLASWPRRAMAKAFSARTSVNVLVHVLADLGGNLGGNAALER